MDVQIVITDSGLGGLSVVAELEKRLRKYPIFKNVELMFFNSLYSSEYGYNSLKDFTDKVEILSPNDRMLDFLFDAPKKLYTNCTVMVRLVTQVKLKENQIKSLSEILANDSPKTAKAIENYEYINNLFAK